MALAGNASNNDSNEATATSAEQDSSTTPAALTFAEVEREQLAELSAQLRQIRLRYEALKREFLTKMQKFQERKRLSKYKASAATTHVGEDEELGSGKNDTVGLINSAPVAKEKHFDEDGVSREEILLPEKRQEKDNGTSEEALSDEREQFDGPATQKGQKPNETKEEGEGRTAQPNVNSTTLPNAPSDSTSTPNPAASNNKTNGNLFAKELEKVFNANVTRKIVGVGNETAKRAEGNETTVPLGAEQQNKSTSPNSIQSTTLPAVFVLPKLRKVNEVNPIEGKRNGTKGMPTLAELAEELNELGNGRSWSTKGPQKKMQQKEPGNVKTTKGGDDKVTKKPQFISSATNGTQQANTTTASGNALPNSSKGE